MKLKEWMDGATPEQVSLLAIESDTTVDYLYQIKGGHRRASPQLAKRLEKGTRKINPLRVVTKEETRPDVYELEKKIELKAYAMA